MKKINKKWGEVLLVERADQFIDCTGRTSRELKEAFKGFHGVVEFEEGAQINECSFYFNQKGTTIYTVIIDGKNVCIYDYAFYGCKDIREIFFSDVGYTYRDISIGKSAFEDCTSLQYVSFPRVAGMKVTSDMFLGDKNLREISFNNNSIDVEVLNGMIPVQVVDRERFTDGSESKTYRLISFPECLNISIQDQNRQLGNPHEITGFFSIFTDKDGNKKIGKGRCYESWVKDSAVALC